MGTRRPDSVESTGSPESGSRPPERISCRGWGNLHLPRPVAVLFHLAVEHDALPRTEDAHQVVAVEPLGVEDAALVAHGRMEGAAAAAPVAHQARGHALRLGRGKR